MTTHAPVQAKQQPEGNRTVQSAHPQGAQQSIGLNADLLALQRSAGNSAVNNMIPSLGGGSSLPKELRSEMEQRFGEDFSKVRVHTGKDAAASTREMGARAYTVGRDVVFGGGRYAPSTNEGKQLLAHELAHVVQQSRGGAAPPMAPGAAHETDAARAAAAAVGGRGTGPGVGCHRRRTGVRHRSRGRSRGGKGIQGDRETGGIVRVRAAGWAGRARCFDTE